MSMSLRRSASRTSLWGLALVLAAITGCSSGGTSTSNNTATAGDETGKPLRLAVIPKGTTHEFWKSVHAGAEQAAQELGNVEIFWKGPLLENDRDGQITVVQDFITKQVNGIVLAPLDSQALVPYVEEAHQANIPVVIFDSGLDDDRYVVSYVATDNYHGGELAAVRLAEALDGKGNVILLRYTAGSESTTQREEGFLAKLKSDYPDITVISSDEFCGTTPESSLDKATQVLEKHRDDVDGIFAVCEPNATGVLGALREQELAGKVKFVAFDPNADLIQGMKEGHVDGIVLQDPVTMGYEAVIAMVRHIRGESVKDRISTGENVATPENMSTPEMDKLLNPVKHEG